MILSVRRQQVSVLTFVIKSMAIADDFAAGFNIRMDLGIALDATPARVNFTAFRVVFVLARPEMQMIINLFAWF
jgi:hypothetical protein